MTRQRISLDTMLSPQGARVVVGVDPDGAAQQAWFDLAGLPRVDAHLVGQPVREVPRIVERLCGICPAAHHLAGIRALEALMGLTAISPAAEDVRRLLHHGSSIDSLAVRLFDHDRESCLHLRRVGRLATRTAGSPGHFPTTGVPGGVQAATDPALVADLAHQAAEAISVAEKLAMRLLATGDPAESFQGPDLALVDDQGRPNLMGTRLRALSSNGRCLVNSARPEEWPSLVGEARPGETAPHPYLTQLGPDEGVYRVGPMAQLRMGPLTTPRAETLRLQWLEQGLGVVPARAIVLLHSCEVVELLAAGQRLLEAQAFDASLDVTEAVQGTGVGWVDGPRGLLVHSYTSDTEGRLVRAQILTPTAQNEPWLGQMLLASVGSPERIEASIQTADPCLPCVSAPAGQMPVTVDTVPAHPNPTVGVGQQTKES